MGSAQILIVEDEELQARGLQKELENLGYSVPAVAASGEEALRKATELAPDLVLMDIVLPGTLDGIETTKRLHERRPVPVIYLSAYEDDDIIQRARETGPYGYLIKPFEERELRATIEMALYRHEIEQRLRDTERWLEATLRSVSEAVIATDVRRHVGFLNPVAEQLTGVKAADALGQDIAGVLRLESDALEAVFGRGESRLADSAGPTRLPQPVRVLARDGRRIPVEGSVAPIRDEHGACTGYVWVLRDVTERQQLEERLRLSAEQFRRSRQRAALSKLAADVANDFNNLLTVVLGNCSLVLCHLPEQDPNLRALLNIEAAALSAMDLVKRLQGYSRRTNPWTGPANLNVTFQKVWDGIRRLIDLPVDMDFRPAPDLWPAQVDAGAAEEILTNLCLNVCNALPRGGRLTLETENVVRGAGPGTTSEAAETADFIRLRLADPSGGIAPLLRARALDSRDSGARATIPGLEEAFESVERYGGWVECASDSRHGTRLDILLPRARPEGASPKPAKEPRDSRRRAPTVLLVDDEPMVRELGRNVLERSGFQVLLAEDGTEAIDVYRHEMAHVDLVVLDLTMPSLSGDDTFRRLVKINPRVRVLFCSGYPSEHVRSLGQEQVVGFISKPYRNEDLLRAVRAAIG